MRSSRHNSTVVVRAPAKVNLYLEVLHKRPDSYHEIATLMVTVSLYDTLEFKEGPFPDIQLSCDHPRLSCGPDNLVYRAAALLQARSGCNRGARIRLLKRIPLAGGLAGGSTDAAATLAGLNRLWRLGISKAELAELGAELGSDVPFFFAAPAAWCTGRGEKVNPVSLACPLYFVLACPGVGLATADVYRGVDLQASDGCQPPDTRPGEEILQALGDGNVEAIGRQLHNRLQQPAEKLCPQIGEILRRLAVLRPAGQMMSGSGSTLFALCRSQSDAWRIVRQLRREAEKRSEPGSVAGNGLQVFVVRSSI